MFSIQQDRIEQAQWRPSPHCDERSRPNDIRLLVIHGISLPAGEFGGSAIDDLFLGCLDCSSHPSFSSLAGLRVSAHCLVRRNGELIQYVPFSKRAWHAGVSEWQGETGCNDFSIGVELEGTDTTPYTEAQYRTLVQLTQALITHYPNLSKTTIVGHEHIAPGRKTDPGPAFDWPFYLSAL
ncbi:1,6-anhydro-N-acetylmuramyl-L-alanine amidase AmpD [Aliidiomarina celeris]|uniref:1,6-anhydro-N-acetylmuramyl-L-alanine amidase AmpD n=1 Tax=Aliidiomarina celeris TaxID=2249428 RepID=UPI000DE83337|nr:1,6-anhydro-N-acetylmuramyl-L-alanine amidase AmpD [Aliidiomarina celeris]